MKILAHINSYIPVSCAGAETMLHSMLKFFLGKGHSCTVLTSDKSGKAGKYDGVVCFTDLSLTDKLYEENDIVITQLNWTKEVIALCKKHNKPLAYLLHNERSVNFWEVKADQVDLMLYNSDWLRDAIEPHHKFGNYHVIIPPVFVKDYKVKKKKDNKGYITLINMNKNKGAVLFSYLAKQMPEYDFLGVKGAYDLQMIQKLSSNVTLYEHSYDIKKVYAETDVLVVPSAQETWGRVAIEAMCSGIPVIAHHTKGLMEAIGGHGFITNREYPKPWMDLIIKLKEDAGFYKEWGNKGIERAKQLEALALTQLDDLEVKFDELISSKKRLLVRS